MRTRNAWPVWLIAALLGGGAWVFTRVYLIATETGEVFPRYSSLRSDPVGARVLHDAVSAMPGLTVRRWFRPLDEFKDHPAVMLFLEDSAARWVAESPKTLAGLEERIGEGLRLVLALRADDRRPPKEPPAIETRWRLALDFPQDRNGVIRFRPLDEHWKIFRNAQDQPMAVERAWGKGSIVFVAGSFPFSNEALRDRRDIRLLTWIAGTYRTIVFDEYHLGTVQTGSVGTLLRHFHLDAAAAVAVLLGLLFVWRNATSFLPPATGNEAAAIEGRDASAALKSLLRRSFPPEQLPALARELWRRSSPLTPARSAGLHDRVEQELARASATDLPGLWRRIHLMLTART